MYFGIKIILKNNYKYIPKQMNNLKKRERERVDVFPKRNIHNFFIFIFKVCAALNNSRKIKVMRWNKKIN